jgi:hypothetical protein
MNKRILIPILLTLSLSTACTTLGPMPAMTMNSPIPSNRTTFEMQGGLSPGFFLSQSTEETSDGTALAQGGVLLDIGKWTGVEGLAVGGRLMDGGSGPMIGEPMVSYRTRLDDDQRFSLGLTGFGSYGEAAADRASYAAGRVGFEAVIDVRATPEFQWIELHFQAGLSATGVLAEGNYCITEEGWGISCRANELSNDRVTASIEGVYPAAFVGANLELFQNFHSIFHGIRAGLFYAAGSMPTVQGGLQAGDHLWHMFGGNLAMAWGARE